MVRSGNAIKWRRTSAKSACGRCVTKRRTGSNAVACRSWRRIDREGISSTVRSETELWRRSIRPAGCHPQGSFMFAKASLPATPWIGQRVARCDGSVTIEERLHPRSPNRLSILIVADPKAYVERPWCFVLREFVAWWLHIGRWLSDLSHQRSDVLVSFALILYFDLHPFPILVIIPYGGYYGSRQQRWHGEGFDRRFHR